MKEKDIFSLLERIEGFDWDEENINKSWLKHQVNNRESEEIFFNQPLLINFDEKHSTKTEKRFQALGKTFGGRKLFVVFTVRNNKIRIISARDQSKKERRIYEKQKT